MIKVANEVVLSVLLSNSPCVVRSRKSRYLALENTPKRKHTAREGDHLFLLDMFDCIGTATENTADDAASPAPLAIGDY